MAVDVFLYALSFVIFACGGSLIFAAWPPYFPETALGDALVLLLGSVLVLSSGYALGMAVA